VLLDTFFNEQDDIAVLTTVAVIGEPGESTDEFRPVKSAQSFAPEKILKTETDRQAPQLKPLDLQMAQPTVKTPSHNRPSPRAKRIAHNLGVDVSMLRGAGPHGRIVEADVRSAASLLTKTAQARKSQEGLVALAHGSGIGGRIVAADLMPPAPPDSSAERCEDEITEIKPGPMRKLIASRMMQSLQGAAQLTMSAYADASALLAFRKHVKDHGTNIGLPDITITDCVAFAVAKTLRNHPELNALYKDAVIHRYKSVHVAMAVDTPRGLMVPVIRFADRLSLSELSTAIKSLAAQCREGSVNPDFLSGGTITITSLGMFGIESFTPILNAPQVAILGINAIAPRPVETGEGVYEMKPHIGFSLTIDHQAVDGAPAARFLKDLCDAVTDIDFMASVT